MTTQSRVAGQVLIVSAASGAGKSSLLSALRERMPELAVAVSHTTRAPRPGEENGRHYHFVEMASFEAMIAADAFIEHAEVFGNRYGTARSSVESLLAEGRDVIVEIDWQGARRVREVLPGSASIYIAPPSRDALEQRLRARGQDSDAVIAGRMAQARSELIHWHEYDYLVVNDDFEVAAEDLVAIVRAQRLSRERQAVTQSELLESLLA
ncbi:MAG: guanylate kinase [Gammaproteobacteria bacterium]|nr:guanylate kinase [Gammaproteobacteria bacterium]MCP5138015.1 guanylate kinase [Gammaproteobacteria bacterium]